MTRNAACWRTLALRGHAAQGKAKTTGTTRPILKAAFAIATEDALSEALAERLLLQAGATDIHARIRKQGFGYLRSRAPDLNRMATRDAGPTADRPRPRSLSATTDRRLAAEPAKRAARISGRGARDRSLGCSQTVQHSLISLACPSQRFRALRMKLTDPKAALLKLVRKSSNRELKQDILPTRGSTSPIGLGYKQPTLSLCAFKKLEK